MKSMKAIVTVLVTLALTSISGYCAQFEVTPNFSTYTNEHLDSGPGINADIGNEWLSLVGSFNQTSFKWGGQHAAQINFASVGIKMKHEFTLGKHNKTRLKLSGSVQWFQPFTTMKGESTREALGYLAGDHVNHTMSDYPCTLKDNPFLWSDRTIEFKGNIGGDITLDITHQFKYADVGITIGYRILEMRSTVIFRDKVLWPTEHLQWNFDRDENFSGPYMGVHVAF